MIKSKWKHAVVDENEEGIWENSNAAEKDLVQKIETMLKICVYKSYSG